MLDFQSNIELYCDVNTLKVQPLWNKAAVSTGRFENKIVDKLTDKLGLSIVYDTNSSPILREHTIQLPPKTFYNASTSYYHSILHEVGHRLSVDLRQTKKFINDAYKYAVMTGEMPNYVKLAQNILADGLDYFKQDKFTSLLKDKYYTKEELRDTATNLVLLYSKEETKVEIIAKNMLSHAGFRLDKHNTDFTKYVCGSMERLNNLFGRSLIEQAKSGQPKSDPVFKMDYDNLLDVYMRRYNEIKKENPKSKSRDGMDM
ncbi:MAG: hypothetical protein LBP51_06265 [Deferribacteraceae bacterium]|jgi:hypothetical protein|nr:hypothetical protein [Deferribacteraceae bacterium]